MQCLPGAVLLSTGFCIYLVVEPGVVAPPVTTAPLGAVVVVADQVAAAKGSNCQSIAAAGVVHILTAAAKGSNCQSIAAAGAAPVPAASSPAAAQSVYMSTVAAAVEAARVLGVVVAVGSFSYSLHRLLLLLLTAVSIPTAAAWVPVLGFLD